MTDWRCSVCFNTSELTKIAGTIICKDCLKKVAETNRNNDNTLTEDMKNAIIKNTMGDIYD